uniref:Large ribosomal subunit protein mL54 n=1 Tax=Aplanochytrium stocchinoi TaxID=215587 RepID=A0A6S8DK06_9STRA|mmetsp:Transcript_35331/g.43610  ORF Transcript_35331/g.43610 Transcript_35331/m.43610 type:complete len:167 (+) Transcript_35331:173-673(+)
MQVLRVSRLISGFSRSHTFKKYSTIQLTDSKKLLKVNTSRCFHTSWILRVKHDEDSEKEDNHHNLTHFSVVVSNSLPEPGTVYLEKSTFEVGSSMPLNIFKEGKDPEVLPDDQYPEWLWGCLIPDETLQDLEARKHELRWDNGGKRYWKLLRRKQIKEHNASASEF